MVRALIIILLVVPAVVFFTPSLRHSVVHYYESIKIQAAVDDGKEKERLRKETPDHHLGFW